MLAEIGRLFRKAIRLFSFSQTGEAVFGRMARLGTSAELIVSDSESAEDGEQEDMQIGVGQNEDC